MNNANSILSDIENWGRARNIIGAGTSLAQIAKLAEEMGELAGGIARNDRDAVIDGIGDMIVVLVMLAGIEGLDVTACMAAAYNEIKDRKGILVDGVFIKESDARYADACARVEQARQA